MHRPFAAIIAVFTLGGCAGELASPERFVSCAPGRVEKIFDNKCSSCHNASDPQGGLDLASANVQSRIVGVNTLGSGDCAGRKLVSVDGEMHVLLDKLADSPSCGGGMPLGSGSLTEIERACIAQWVTVAVEQAGGQ
jgi:predicted metal-binding protein